MMSLFEKQDSLDTMSRSTEQSRREKKGAGEKECLWKYSRITLQGPLPIPYHGILAHSSREVHRPLFGTLPPTQETG
jgi:hypothetical protein